MHSKFEEIKQSTTEILVEKKHWIKPNIDVHDFVEMTQQGCVEDGNYDGPGSYSQYIEEP